MTVFRGNLNRSGVYSTHGISRLQGIKWRFKTGGEIFSSPALVDDWVYFGSTDGYCYGLDLRTGSERWRAHTARQGGVTPAVHGDTLYCEGASGLYALSRVTGHERGYWSEQPYGANSPCVVDGTLYYGTVFGLRAIDLDTGKQRWLCGTSGWVIAPPAFAEHNLYLGSFDHRLYAVEVSSGRVLWTFETGWHIANSPAAQDGMVYVSSEDRYVYALDWDTGKVIWKYHTEDIPTGFCVTDTGVFFGIWNQRVLALDRWSGREQWRFVTHNRLPSTPSIAQEVLYVGDGDFEKSEGWVYALDWRTGEERWSVQLGGGVRSFLTVHKGILYFGSDDSHLYALQ